GRLGAREVLRQEVEGFGYLMAALGAGARAAAAGLAQFGRGRPPFPVLVLAAGAASVAVLALAVVQGFWGAVVLLFVAGFAQIVFMSGSNTTLQITTPDELRGRVMALYALAFSGVSPLGAFLVGGVAEGLGTRAA